ncbi:MAG TPA: VWA domain-containing protein [Polyangiaceae bacterium]
MHAVELLNVKGLALLAGLIPLIVMYILKIRRERLRVPSTWLWAAAERDLLAKHPFKKLVAQVPLFLQILALLLLAFALARPAARGGTIVGDHVAIVIDTSASMGAVAHAHDAPGPTTDTRMTEAIKAANDLVASLSPGADAIIVEAAREPRVVSPLDRDARHLRAAISTLSAREVEGDLEPAVALAADRLRALGGKKKIVVVTDGALAKNEPLAASGISTDVVQVGEPVDNAAIVRIDIRSGVDPQTHRDQAQAFAMLENYSAAPRDVFVTLTVAGRADSVASRRVLLPPNAKTPVVLAFEPSRADEGSPLTVRISPAAGGPDALPTDDVAFGRVPGGRHIPVVLATDEASSWIGRAAASDPDVDLQRIKVAELATVNIDPDALVIVEGACPAVFPGRDVLVAAPPLGTCLGVDVQGAVEQPDLTSWDGGDARLRFLTLDGVHLAKATPLAAEGGGASLVRAGKITLIADASTPGRTATIVGFDVGESDWPLKASFVLFVRNVIELAQLHRSQGGAGPARTGEPLRIAVPNGVTSTTVEAPGIPEHDVEAKGGFAVLPGVDKAGIVKVRWSTPHVGNVTIPINLTSEAESDVRAKPITVDAAAGPQGAEVRPPDAHHEWTVWLALVATLFLLFDLWWYTRGRTRLTAEKAT